MTIAILCITPNDPLAQGISIMQRSIRYGSAIAAMVGGIDGVLQLVNHLDAVR